MPESVISTEANVQESELLAAVEGYLSPFLSAKGFKEEVKSVNENSSYYRWRSNEKYFLIKTSTYPTDYPGRLGMWIGVGHSEVAEARWRSIALFELGRLHGRPDFPSVDGWPRGDMSQWIKGFIVEIEEISGGFFTSESSGFHAMVRAKNQNQQVLGYSVVSKGREQFYSDPEDAELKRRFT